MTAVFDAPIITSLRHVEPEWVDYNGHMNVGYYTIAFDKALDDVYDMIGMGEAYAAKGDASTFTLESHITYQQEMTKGDPIEITFQLLDLDEKRIHYFMHMYHQQERYLAATMEQLSVHVDLHTRRSSAVPEEYFRQLVAIQDSHKSMPRPEQAGSVIGIRRK